MKAFLFLIVVAVILIGIGKGWWINPKPGNGQPGDEPGNEQPGDEPKGVSPSEMEMLNWFRRNGCTVEIPGGSTQTYKFFENAGIPYDKSYQITWQLEFKDVIPYDKPGDPVIPSPGRFARKTLGGIWSSAGDSYHELLKIKEDFQKHVAAGYVVR